MATHRPTPTPSRPEPAGPAAAGCRAHEVLARVGDKWSVYVLHLLGEGGTLRFSELRRRVDGVSQRMLAVTLRGLERDGLVSRAMYPEVPPRVEYTLTPLGETLRGVAGALFAWAHAHLPEVDAARARYDGQDRGWGAGAPGGGGAGGERSEPLGAREFGPVSEHDAPASPGVVTGGNRRLGRGA